jgi:hypothetical protein
MRLLIQNWNIDKVSKVLETKTKNLQGSPSPVYKMCPMQGTFVSLKGYKNGLVNSTAGKHRLLLILGINSLANRYKVK